MIGRDSNSPNMYAHIHMTVKCVVETATLLNICSYSHLCQMIGRDGNDCCGSLGGLSGRPAGAGLGVLLGWPEGPGRRLGGLGSRPGAWEACLGGLGGLGGRSGRFGSLDKPNLREGSLKMNFRSKSSKRPQEAPRAPRGPKSSKSPKRPRTLRSPVPKHC